MSKLQPVRGTHDIFPEENAKRRALMEQVRVAFSRYGFGEFTPPVFEFSEVFQRTLGDTSDVVTKETYSFEDRGGERITLRPEFTASLARAFISHGLKDRLPLKYYYHGPAFRYERPQKGRLRQFTQFGAEWLGVAEPQADIEIIALAADILAALGLKNKVTLELNTLGDAASRASYRDALVNYLQLYKDALSPESQLRLECNPLRVLDSKDKGDREILVDAPRMDKHFTAEAAQFFARVTDGLNRLGIPFTVNERLVRGLDYYCHTVFEFTSTDLGAQSAVLAGGRYDQLVELMGGPPTPGIGFAAGVERLLMLYENTPAAPRPVVIIPLGEKAEAESYALAHALRAQGFYCELELRGNMAKRMKRADKYNAAAALLLGDDELAKGVITLRDLGKGEQREVPLAAIADALTAMNPGKL